MSKRVILDWTEQLFAAQAGVMRRLSAINHNRPEPYGEPSLDLWGNDINSAGAEAAVAKYFQIYWQSVRYTDRAQGDVGPIQVRSTRHPEGRLIIHKRDPSSAPYVLVRGSLPTYDLIGWIYGSEGKSAEHWFLGDGRHAYFVKEEFLRPIDELVDELRDASGSA